MADLGEVLGVEQGGLQGSAFAGEGLDCRGPQRTQPTQVTILGAQRVEPGGGDHPSVTDHHHLVEVELVPDDLDRVDECGRVGGVAGKHLDRDRAPGGVGEQTVLDLGAVLLSIAGVATGRERAVTAFHPRGGQVE